MVLVALPWRRAPFCGQGDRHDCAAGREHSYSSAAGSSCPAANAALIDHLRSTGLSGSRRARHQAGSGSLRHISRGLCVSASTCACASPRQIINVSIIVRVVLPCHTSHLTALPGRAACASSPTQPPDLTNPSGPSDTQRLDHQQFSLVDAHQGQRRRVPLGLIDKVISNLYTPYQTHRIQSLHCRTQHQIA